MNMPFGNECIEQVAVHDFNPKPAHFSSSSENGTGFTLIHVPTTLVALRHFAFWNINRLAILTMNEAHHL